jgi:hypothetical protein
MNPKIKDFIERQAVSQYSGSLWFEDERNHFNVYIRAGKAGDYSPRVGFVKAVCISNITVEDIFTRTGVFTRFVDELKEMMPELGFSQLQIENANSPEMQAWCVKNRCHLRQNCESPCFYIQL